MSSNYFNEAVEWDGQAAYPPEFRHMAELEGFEPAPGVRLHPLWGQNMMASYVTFAPHAVAPLHQHPQEQFSVVLSGRLQFTVGNETRWMEVGDIVTIPPHVPHAATAGGGGCTAVDMFSPPREGFRELLLAAGKDLS